MGFQDYPRSNTMFQDGKIPSRMANGECTQISAQPCELAASTSNDHNFLIRTLIHAFLGFKESSLSLEFNKIKCLSKTWAEHWAGSQTVEEWFVLVFETSVSGTGLYLKCSGLCLA